MCLRRIRWMILLVGLGLVGCQRPSETTSPASQPAATQAAVERDDDPTQDSVEADPVTTQTALSVGDPAPPILVAEWLRGEPIDQFEPGKVHVVEFWATWCSPCLHSMPHLSELQTNYADQVNVIGISDEDAETIRQFLQQTHDTETGTTWSDVISYRIAIDQAGAPTELAYRVAAEQAGIPVSFIVGIDGKVQWIGHPMRMDGPLGQVIEGSWDLQQAARDFEAQRLANRLQDSLQPLIRDARRSGSWDAVLAEIDAALELYPTSTALNQLKLTLLLLAKQFDQADVFAGRFSDLAWDDPATLNEIAWSVVTRIPKNQRDAEKLLVIAQRAAELTQFENASILDTLARICFEQGDLDDAIRWQQRAVEATDQGNRELLRQTLETYRAQRASALPDESATEDASSSTPPDSIQ